MKDEEDGAVAIPIEGTLDLHTFKPSEAKDLVPEYLRECLAKGILRVRVVHGKGTGTLATMVRSTLRKLPEVASFEEAGPDEGGWGATIVHLKGTQYPFPNSLQGASSRK